MRFLRTYIPTIISLMVIGIICLAPISDMPSIVSAAKIPHFDKFVHAFSFLLLAIIAWADTRKYTGKRDRAYIVSVLLSVIYGGLIEIIQDFTNTRSSDILDWIADITGMATGIAIIVAWRKLGTYQN